LQCAAACLELFPVPQQAQTPVQAAMRIGCNLDDADTVSIVSAVHTCLPAVPAIYHQHIINSAQPQLCLQGAQLAITRFLESVETIL
jgi:hypothetical protein